MMKVATWVAVILVLIVATGCRRQTPPPSPAVVAAQPPEPAAAVATAVAPPVAEAVAEVPAYHGAVQIERKQTTRKDGFAKVESVKLHSADTLAAVKTFYAGAITAGGWQVAGSKDRPDEAEWKLVKGTSTVAIELDAKRAGGVDISIERRDR